MDLETPERVEEFWFNRRDIATFARGRTQDGSAHGAVLWREALMEIARRAEAARGRAR